MALSIQKRWEIVFLPLHKLGPKLSLRTIARKLQYSQDTVRTWIHRYQKTGDVHDEEKQGRKRKNSEREDLDIISIAKKKKKKKNKKGKIGTYPQKKKKKKNKVQVH